MLTYDVPTIMCYEHADTFMNKTAPVRGSAGVRPLGQRRYWKDRWMRFDNTKVKHTIGVGVYINPFVLFYPDNRIEFQHGGWVATRQVIDAMFRPRFKCRYASNSKWYLFDYIKNVQYPVTPTKPLVLHYVKTEQGVDYVYKGELIVEQKPYVIRKEYIPIVNQYSNFLKYVEVMNKLSGGVYSEDQIPPKPMKYIGQQGQTTDMALELVANKTMESAPEEFATAFNFLLAECARHIYYPRNVYECTTTSMKKYVHEWIKQNHKDTIYEMRDVPNTTIIR